MTAAAPARSARPFVPRPRRSAASRTAGTEDAPRPLVIDIYARLSHDPDGGGVEKVERQIEDCRRKIEANPHWMVGVIHSDNSLSAWKRTVKRPGWTAMLDRIELRQADGVIVWHSDRLLRQPEDLERLITFGEKSGLVIASCYGEHDPSKGDDRMMMRALAMMAEKSSADASRRIKRKRQAAREAGNVAGFGGGRAFGFAGKSRIHDGEGDAPMVPAEQVAAERAAIRTATEEVAAGVALAAIVRRWNGAKLRSATGALWTTNTLRDVLSRPRNAGLIEHEGVTVGRTDDPIIDEDTFNRARAVFASRRRGRPASGKYVGSGLIRCGACGHTMGGRPAGKYRDGTDRTQYVCKRDAGGCGEVAVDGRGMDNELREFVIMRLGHQYSPIAARVAATADRLAEIEGALRVAHDTVTALGDRLGRGEITLDTFDAANRPVKARIDALTAERNSLAVDQTQRPTDAAGDPDAVANEWESSTSEERRAMLVNALRGGARITVAPAARRGAFDRTRVKVNEG